MYSLPLLNILRLLLDFFNHQLPLKVTEQPTPPMRRLLGRSRCRWRCRRERMAEDSVKLHNMETALMDKMRQHDASEPRLFERLFQPCVAELVGTAFFVFIGCVSVIEHVADAGRLQPALAHGLALAALIACMAEIRSDAEELDLACCVSVVDAKLELQIFMSVDIADRV